VYVPTVLVKDGFRFFFYSREGNEPPHIHVIGKGGEMKIWLGNLSIATVYALSPKEQRIVCEIAGANIALFKAEWEKFHGSL
jgi:hypothetical protein